MNKNQNKEGRPKIDVDLELVKRMCGINCTAEEICATIGVSPDTLDRRLHEEYKIGFAEFYKKNTLNSCMSLRRAMWKNAISNENTTMQIFLAKNTLGMRDNPDRMFDDETAPINVTFKVVDASKRTGADDTSEQVFKPTT
jgi:hypothetical protein